jgi:hypothetical protein
VNYKVRNVDGAQIAVIVGIAGAEEALCRARNGYVGVVCGRTFDGDATRTGRQRSGGCECWDAYSGGREDCG